jgi:hypothetical protein
MEKQKFFLRLGNLQHFNDVPPTDTPPSDTSADTPPALTMEDVQKLIQSEVDKVRTTYSQQLKGKDKELDDLKKQNMSAEERANLALEEAEKKEKEIQIRENKLFAVEELQKAQMPMSFLQFVTAESDEATTDKITALKSTFDSAVAEAVEEKFKGAGRKFQKGSGGVGEITVEQFNKMSYKERVDLMNNDPDTYQKLKNS